jgi:hypothetical protein
VAAEGEGNESEGWQWQVLSTRKKKKRLTIFVNGKSVMKVPPNPTQHWRARDQGKAVNLTDSISMLVFGYSLLPSVPQEKSSKCCPLVVRALHNKSMIKAGTG